MSLTQWLYDLASCKDDLKRIDFDGVEDALEELLERSDRIYLDYNEPGSTATGEERAALLEMADLLSAIAQDLELFLETVYFHHVSDALSRARDLAHVRDGLRSHVESICPDLEREAIG